YRSRPDGGDEGPEAQGRRGRPVRSAPAFGPASVEGHPMRVVNVQLRLENTFDTHPSSVTGVRSTADPGRGGGQGARRQLRSFPSFYMVNCAHPTHLLPTLESAADRGDGWLDRFRGFRANASTKEPRRARREPHP